MCRTGIASAAVFAMLLCAHRAAAQWAFEVERPWRQYITAEDIDDLIDSVPLSEAQAFATRKMFDEYTARFHEAVLRDRDRFEKIRGLLRGDTVSPAERFRMVIEREDMVVEVSHSSNTLWQTFLDDVFTILDETQHARFRQFVQRLVRKRQLSFGRKYVDERVDLLAVLNDAEVGDEDIVDRSAFDAIVEAYAEAMHVQLMRKREKYLQARDLLIQSNRLRIGFNDTTVFLGTPSDPEKFETLQAKLKSTASQARETHRAVYQLNRTHRDLFAGVMTEEALQRFLDSYDRACFPWAFDPPYNRTLRLAEELESDPSITAEQQEAIHAVTGDFIITLERLYKAYGRVSNDLADVKLGLRSGSSTRERLEEDVNEALDRIYDYEAKINDRIWSVLTPEQRERHRKPEKRERVGQ